MEGSIPCIPLILTPLQRGYRLFYSKRDFNFQQYACWVVSYSFNFQVPT